jgi:hypothetical protein
MKRYVIASGDKIYQILSNEPQFVPDDREVLVYEGNAPDHRLCISNGVVVDKYKQPAVTIDEYKSTKVVYVDQLISNLRMSVFSTVFGQMDVYYEKTQQAIDYKSEHYPTDASRFPYVKLEAEVTECSFEEAADKILAKRKQWSNISLQTERIRLYFNKHITQANSATEVDDLVNSVSEELSTLL